ncbi:MAG: DUF1732 domain-containing protein [Polyangiaceae bacterium]
MRARAEAARDGHRVRLAERFERVGVALDALRIESEVAVLVERIDVAEEVHRLRTHLAHFVEIVVTARAACAAGTHRPDEPEGRRLDFLLQEMLREATTLSAKAQDAAISTDVVAMKVELDRMREQVQNVE